jgi:hypothetical protein
MSRQVDLVREERETARRDALVSALEYGLAGHLEAQGITLIGFAVKYDAYECLMTLKADIGGERQVCFIGSDSVMSAILKAVSAAKADRLRWKKDKWAPSNT